jgi:hypothetical protein
VIDVKVQVLGLLVQADVGGHRRGAVLLPHLRCLILPS